MLYELLAGTRAFTGDSTAQILSAVLRDDPGPLEAPAALQQIVRRRLAKDPGQRFQTMADVRHALQHVTPEYRQSTPGATGGASWRTDSAVVNVDGDIAMDWVPFGVRVGGKVSNCGIDHFGLIREQGDWKVINLTFSSRTNGCPAQ